MARSFTTSQKLSRSAPITAVPFTIAGWFKCADATNFYRAASLSLSSANNYYSLLFRGDVTGDPVEFHRVSSTSGTQVIATTSGYSATTWTHAACVASAANAGAVYLGGGSKTTGTTNVVNNGLNDFSLNAQYFGASYIYSGAALQAAEVGLWSVSLDDAEIAALAKGYSPLEIRPAALVAYYPLGGHYGPSDVDRWKNRYDLTPSGSPTWADHPRVIYSLPSWGPIKATISASTYTAAVSATIGAATAAISAQHVRPTYTAAVSGSVGASTAAIAASHVVPTYTAAVAGTLGAATASVAAAHVTPTFTASISATAGAATGAVSASHVTPTFAATVSATAGATTGAVSATYATPVFAATVSATIGATSASVSASHVAPVFTAAISGSTGAATAEAVAAFATPTYSASVSGATGAIVAVVVASHVVPTFTGTVSGATSAASCQVVASATVPTFAAVVSAVSGAATASIVASHVAPTSSGSVAGSTGAATASVSGLFTSGLLSAIVEAQTGAATAAVVSLYQPIVTAFVCVDTATLTPPYSLATIGNHEARATGYRASGSAELNSPTTQAGMRRSYSLATQRPC